jgi:hypothetical protein
MAAAGRFSVVDIDPVSASKEFENGMNTGRNSVFSFGDMNEKLEGQMSANKSPVTGGNKSPVKAGYKIFNFNPPN